MKKAVQADGPQMQETPSDFFSEKPERKRGRPPACESILNKYPYKKLVFYSDPLNRRHLRTGIGIFWDGKSPGPAMMQFVERKDGTLKWNNRTIRNAHSGADMPHYDMLVLVSSTMLKDISLALNEVLVEWFGGQKEADSKMLDWEKNVQKTDTLTAKIKRTGWA